MPTFAPNGPFVPDRLVQQLEDDRVVIFCGAGISMGAGLPDYQGLVRYCSDELGVPLPANKSTEWMWPDRMLGAIESRFPAGAMRLKVAERLDAPPTDLGMHRAILKLAKIRRGNGLRLVTTNYDTFFERAQEGLVLGLDLHSGPVLPVPRSDRIASWRSIVYLHGRLAPLDDGNDHLVLTSADFGRAYLTEAWAARFVARLFADFTVLFVGYSLNDPVLRYMTDAFAAEDRTSRLHQPREPAYIFVPYKGSKEPDRRPWTERNIEPIFYNETHRHVRLKNTLVAWAEARQDYLSNTRVMIKRIAPTPPEKLNPSDVDNLIWAIAGRPGDQGYGARVFSGLDEPPPIQWLTVLARHEEKLTEEHRKAVQAAQENGNIEPPAPILNLHSLFPRILNQHCPLSSTAQALIPWILRQLHSFEFSAWVIDKIRNGHRPHAILSSQIRNRLLGEAALKDGFIRFWHIVSAEGDWAYKRQHSLGSFDLARFIISDPESPCSICELDAALRPLLTVGPSINRFWPGNDGMDHSKNGSRFSDIAEADVEISDENVLLAIIKAIDALPTAEAFWASRLDMLTNLLQKTFDLYAVAGQAGPDYDPSSYQRPSIEPHQQNRIYKSWTIFFELIWRGWVYVDQSDGPRSREYISRWRRIPYLGFRRLTLATIRSSMHFSSDEKLDALLDG